MGKSSIINPSHNRSKCYAPVVLGYSKATFLRKWEDAAFCPSLSIVFCLYMTLQNRRRESSDFFVFHNSGGILLSYIYIYCLKCDEKNLKLKQVFAVTVC